MKLFSLDQGFSNYVLLVLLRGGPCVPRLILRPSYVNLKVNFDKIVIEIVFKMLNLYNFKL